MSKNHDNRCFTIPTTYNAAFLVVEPDEFVFDLRMVKLRLQIMAFGDKFGFNSKFRVNCWPTLRLDSSTLDGNYDYRSMCLATWYVVELLQFWISHPIKYGYNKLVTFSSYGLRSIFCVSRSTWPKQQPANFSIC